MSENRKKREEAAIKGVGSMKSGRKMLAEMRLLGMVLVQVSTRWLILSIKNQRRSKNKRQKKAANKKCRKARQMREKENRRENRRKEREARLQSRRTTKEQEADLSGSFGDMEIVEDEDQQDEGDNDEKTNEQFVINFSGLALRPKV
ncbi:hypothetical protein NHQ30_004251 [Ciborinia camelliae]|nr:hypothetical protein NHQ30_004251 [Ciborinia camelliae]